MHSISGFRCEKMCAKYKNIHWFAFYANREWIEKILHGKEHCCSITGSSTHDNHSKHTAKHYTLHIPVLTLRLIRLTERNSCYYSSVLDASLPWALQQKKKDGKGAKIGHGKEGWGRTPAVPTINNAYSNNNIQMCVLFKAVKCTFLQDLMTRFTFVQYAEQYMCAGHLVLSTDDDFIQSNWH